MPDIKSEFEEKQIALKSTRAAVDTARTALYTQQELLKLQQIKIKNRLIEERIAFIEGDTDPDQMKLVDLQDQVYQNQLALESVQYTNAEAETAFHELGSHTNLVENLEVGTPVLLLPLRVHTRFVNVKHLATNISKESVFDVSDLEEEEVPILKFSEDKKWDKIPNYSDYTTAGGGHVLNFKSYFHAFKQGQLYKDRNWLKIVPDALELWVRIYPDDIFVHSHETHLTPIERADGEAFWATWWAIHRDNKGSDPLAEEHEAEDLSGKPLFGAWSILQQKHSHSRAAWIFKETMPNSYRDSDSKNPPNYDVGPDFSGVPVKIKSDVWTQPILSWVMPDKFVVTLIQGENSYNFEGNPIPHPLKLTPVPSANHSLDEVKWIEDFDEAEKLGMAIRIPIKSSEFDVNEPLQKLVVVGVKNSVTAEEGKQLLEDLMENHRFKDKGMAILPQGTPTNNFERVRSGYTTEGLPKEEVFKLETGKALFGSEAQWKTKKDGQYLVDALGINSATFQYVHKADSRDIAHAMAMNKLLWSGTMGYYLQQFFQPLISPESIAKTRGFFMNHVAASGQIPVFRVNKQPYGILPITNFSSWVPSSDEDGFFQDFYEKVLTPLNDFWGSLAETIKNIADPALHLEQGQFSQELIRILGLNAGSKSVFQRPQLGNYLIENAITAGSQPFTDISARLYYPKGLSPFFKALGFESLGYEPGIYGTKERVLSQHFASIYQKFPNHLIEGLKLSNSRLLSEVDLKIGEGIEELNYLEWLKQSSYKDLMTHHFSKENKAEGQPDSLLYLLARQAIARNYIEVSASLVNGLNKTISTIDFEMEHLSDEMTFSQIGSNKKVFGEEVNHYLKKVADRDKADIETNDFLYNNNKWTYLEKKTGETGGQTIGELLDGKIKSDSTAKDYLPLTDAKRALGILADLSTADLQRLFSEHLDLCSYRLDAWMLGLVNRRLSKIRAVKPTGIYLGAFGYLEGLDPGSAHKKNVFRVLAYPEVEENPATFDTNQLVLPMLDFQSFATQGIYENELLGNAYVYLGETESKAFERSEKNPEKIVNVPYEDSANQGFIHTPSQAHAITAAILRSGYMANQPSEEEKQDNPGKHYDEFAINLSSERVRKALYYIEGMRNGQELAALLGYQFERDLHDNPLPFLDAYILDFRQRFPLRKEKEETNTNENAETIRASNVVHGLDMLNLYREYEENIVSFLTLAGVDLALPNIDTSEAVDQIKKALDHLSQSMDAISDLLVSESIYHTAKGDVTRSGSVLKMLGGDKEIAIPEITKTPKKGFPLSHLVGVHFNLKSTNTIWRKKESPRSLLNPGLNRWLFEQLPHPTKMCFNVDVNGELKKLNILHIYTIAQPIDLLALIRGKNPFSETSALTYLIKSIAVSAYKPPIDAPIQVLYDDKRGMTKTQNTLGELKPLFENLIKIIDNSRPLFPTDLQLSSRGRPLEAASYDSLDNSELLSRFEHIVNGTVNGTVHDTFNRMHNWIKSWTNKLKEAKTLEEQQPAYDVLIRLLNEQYLFTELFGDYNFERTYSEKQGKELIEKGETAYKHFAAVAESAKLLLTEVKNRTNKKKQWEGLVELAKLLFGHTLTLSPKFKLNNLAEFTAAKEFPDLMADIGEDAPIEWLQGLSRVRKNIKTYKELEIYRHLFSVQAKSQALDILQLPFQSDAANYRWLGSSFSPQIKIRGEQLSIALEYPTGHETTDLPSGMMGMIIDSWTERIQSENVETAFALHYNQPNAEPPQSCLLCVSPKLTGNWEWDDLVGSVLSAMDMAKKRAVEPAHWEKDSDERPDDAYYMEGHPIKFLLPALSIPVSNTSNTPALGFDEDNNHF